MADVDVINSLALTDNLIVGSLVNPIVKVDIIHARSATSIFKSVFF